MKKIVVLVTSVIATFAMTTSFARTFEFKPKGTRGASTGAGDAMWTTTTKIKSALFGVKVGSASKGDDVGQMEIRAATIFKNAKDKRTGVNDIATFKFEPINTSKPLFFTVSTGMAKSRTDKYWADSNRSSGWQVAGCIIEIWQGGKLVKHWSNVPGNGGKSKLTDAVKCLFIDADGDEHSSMYSAFDNATEIYSVNKDGERVDIDEVLEEFRASPDAAEGKENGVAETHKAEAFEEMVDPDEFKLKSFCGFVFGEPKSDLEQKVVKMQRPFRHYTIARPRYGESSGRLISVRLESQMRFEDQDARNEAVAGVASVIEKKYGISLQDSGSGYNFYRFYS
ncbi:MAG: hypothetical protein KBT68_00920, partial [bacterium]|nr:hypothetical protein [Candidatus Colisoma equi]